MERGLRVEVPAHYDCWMMGDRFGTVEKVTRLKVHVLMDRSGKVRRFPRDVFEEHARTFGQAETRHPGGEA